MNKKVLGVFGSLLVVAILMLPISTAFAEKPITLTLTGTYWMIGPPDPEHLNVFTPGNSDNVMTKIRDFAVEFGPGDIIGSGVYHSNWMTNPHKGIFPGFLALEDVTIDVVGFTGTGDLKIGAFEERLTIESGSDDLRSIRGRGRCEVVTFPFEVEYELVVQINP